MGWQQLVFCIPLAAGLFLAAGAAFHHAHDVWLPRVLQALPFAIAASAAAGATLLITRRQNTCP